MELENVCLRVHLTVNGCCTAFTITFVELQDSATLIKKYNSSLINGLEKEESEGIDKLNARTCRL